MDCKDKDICPHLKELEERIKKLEAIISKNSSNSSKPPSSDQKKKKKTKSLRGKSGKKSGGQKGHKGSTLKQTESPNYVEVHKASEFCDCGCHLKNVEVSSIEKRQVFDIPPVTVEVTEHQSEKKVCPGCGKTVSGTFPGSITQPVQYGPRIKAAVLYFSDYQLLPMLRITELFRDIFGHGLSEGTIDNIRKKGAENLARDQEQRKEELLNSLVVHFDESGVRVDSSNAWLHSASNEDCTFYYIHEKRGSDAMNDIGILPDFEGFAGHDFWKPYFKYKESVHFLCNAHHLRELKYIDESEQHVWAKKMSELLLEILSKRNELEKCDFSFIPTDKASEFVTKYRKILYEWEKYYPPPENIPGKRGRKKQAQGKNLLDRLKNHEDEVLSFMYDFRIPFSNNIAEGDVRMMKVKGKVSGCFRKMEGAQRFAVIRGFISTVRKKGQNLFEKLCEIFFDNQKFCLG